MKTQEELHKKIEELIKKCSIIMKQIEILKWALNEETPFYEERIKK